jgi:hypothetical protein
MANDSMATQRAECIKLQSERVVRAYNELRGAAHSADFKSDEFPVGRFAELVTEIKRLEGWLEPVADESDDEAETVCERATRELTNVRKIIVEIDHLAHDGQESRDPAVTLAVIKRLAAEGQSHLYGRLWDDLTGALERS